MFGDNLLNKLTEKKIYQVEMAKSLNISPACLNGYVKNKREPDFSTLVKISKYLNCSIDYLLSNNDSPSFFAKIDPAVDPEYATMVSQWNKMDHGKKMMTLGYMERLNEEPTKVVVNINRPSTLK